MYFFTKMADETNNNNFHDLLWLMALITYVLLGRLGVGDLQSLVGREAPGASAAAAARAVRVAGGVHAPPPPPRAHPPPRRATPPPECLRPRPRPALLPLSPPHRSAPSLHQTKQIYKKILATYI